MLKSRKKQESGSPNVPAYIVTFSDMVTLLLTFFVMLLSLAQVRDPELFNRSRNAFIAHIDCYGLGMLTGKQLVPELGELKIKYQTPAPDEKPPQRIIDSKEEDLRRLFQKVIKSMHAVRTEIEIRPSDYTVTSIVFPRGQAALKDADQKYLSQFAMHLQQKAAETIEIYVLGLAGDESTEKNQWIISSLRAQNVADFLRESGIQCPVYAWGAGAGGHWLSQEKCDSEQTHILLAVRRVDKIQ
ncbi:MAG TPA: flagellar motor protein MotB [Anaerohalosphaeraceae bacterium]|nr:flagellar motor protein MotB [Anaerohalosphaeraceae bacterium]HOL30764.1 flagellar motor protein MotB [Anaerohalosphaeraceae bacterium]HOM75421.1 flagellar motor protein MotB [Anaerohalosphaeraceae bacterium]HPC63019.1 flagellar motor protein MotB [Anaerohalosphaeraceae bacterium]HPO69218.1 flagellar motor protein MotB [Anaerohalosphaeraceae bacterium]